MKLYRFIERVLEGVIGFFWKLFILIHEMKNIWTKRALVKAYTPTADEANAAGMYWRGILGRRHSLVVAQTLCELHGRVRSSILPRDLVFDAVGAERFASLRPALPRR